MSSTDATSADSESSSQAAQLLYAEHLNAIHQRTDRLFAWLMGLQWLVGVAVALWVSPRAWEGTTSSPHVHVWAAVLLGGLMTSLPVVLAIYRPGRTYTRYVIAVAQMLFSALLIHLTGGRIETHFHVFGSLAILACYRDLRLLVVATIVVTIDHSVRGYFWPQSAYGIVTASPWRILEHTGWVVFENVFLAITVRQSLDEMRHIARQRAALSTTNEIVEQTVQRRTIELERSVQAHADAERVNRDLADAIQDHADTLQARNAELLAIRENLSETVRELQDKNQELNEFAYVASHDLQEPIRKLVSFSKLLRQDVGSDLNEAAQRDLEFIVDAADRMRQLVQDLLALSRTGCSEMKRERTSLTACVHRAMEMLELTISESDTSITIDDLPEVDGDATLLTQIYQNLIGNAVKFVADDRPVIHVTAERRDDQWVFGVKDQGIGIERKYADRIFSPFQRLHGRDEYAGTGIGLAICKKSVQRHGGKIWLDSEPGKGSHFQFTLETRIEAPICTENEEREMANELSSC